MTDKVRAYTVVDGKTLHQMFEDMPVCDRHEKKNNWSDGGYVLYLLHAGTTQPCVFCQQERRKVVMP